MGLRRGWSIGVMCLGLSGCGDDAPASETNASSESSTADGSTSIDPDTSVTDPSADSSSSSESSTSSSSSSSESSSTSESSSSSDSSWSSASSSSSESSSSSDDSSSEEAGTDPPATESGGCEAMPDGSFCAMPCECSSGICYEQSILGGLCGECLGDADCPGGGCTQPDPLVSPPVGSVCNDGGFGDGCESDVACQDPYICVDVLDIPGILTTSTCSECETDADCGFDLCAPEYGFPSLRGYWECVAPLSKPDGSGCSLGGSGDLSCISGICAEADVMMLFSVGVCSPCEVDADCHDGDICEPAQVDLDNGLVPAHCVTP